MWHSNRTVPKDEIRQLDLETRVRIEAQITDERAMALDALPERYARANHRKPLAE